MTSRSTVTVYLILVVSFAMFSMIFGGGNFILPPLLGLRAGDSWMLVSLAFGIAGVFIPIVGMLMQSKRQLSIIELGRDVHPVFGVVFALSLLGICLSFPVPRTASVSYELAVEGVLPISSLAFDSVYFFLVMLLCLYRSSMLDVIGKFLTPILLGIIFAIILRAVFFVDATPQATTLESPFRVGLLEGYQTFDAIASIVVGGVIARSLAHFSFGDRQKLIGWGGLISGVLLFLIYMGFIYAGAILRGEIATEEPTRAEVLSTAGRYLLGSLGYSFLSISVSIACFTTAVGIIAGVADCVEELTGSQLYMRLTIVGSCILGLILGETGVDGIIEIGVPIIVLLYPTLIMLIFLKFSPNSWTGKGVYRAVISTALVLSLPDFFSTIGYGWEWARLIPLSEYQLGWVLPCLIVWGISRAVLGRQAQEV